jgi:DNA repair protein RadA/Sms
VTWAKANEVAALVTGHVTKAGEIAGPKLLEHAVDAVCYFESAGPSALRILRSVKNRFGTVDEVGVFEMTSQGLTSVDNPSGAFLDVASLDASGCAASAVIEGTRPLAVEIQALAVPSHLATPRRTASGIEIARLHLLLAVLSRRAGLQASDRDVVASVAGGLRLRDTSVDLAVLGALASAVVDRPLRRGVALLGEVSLSGRIRPVPQSSRRLAELARVGIDACIAAPGTPPAEGVEIIEAETVRDAIALALPGSRA